LKKVAAILMLLVFLFNVGGYYFVFYGIAQHSKKKLVHRFDNETYSAEETITLAISITMPYPIFTDDYQRVNGEFEHNGEHYKLIKQKLDGDSLYIVCYKDRTTKRILDAFSDFAKFSNDLPLSSENSLAFMGKVIKDYEPVQKAEPIGYAGWSHSIELSQPVFRLLDREYVVFSPPPEQVV
jgi:hypothetical protein